MAVNIAKDETLSQNPFPGTVQLEDRSGSTIYLSPKPTRDPNDPLVSAQLHNKLCDSIQLT